MSLIAPTAHILGSAIELSKLRIILYQYCRWMHCSTHSFLFCVVMLFCPYYNHFHRHNLYIHANVNNQLKNTTSKHKQTKPNQTQKEIPKPQREQTSTQINKQEKTLHGQFPQCVRSPSIVAANSLSESIVHLPA